MDAAHELAHAILHRDVTDEQLKADFDIIERQAFRLASAFLMPADTFPLDVRVPTLSGFLAIKDRWRVSIKAMIRRCQDLDILETEDARQLYKYYSAKGWSREEPLDRSVPHAEPRMLASALRMIVENGARSKADLIASDFVFPGKDVAELVGLPEDWFSLGDVIPLRMAATKGPLAFAGTSEVVSVNFADRVRR
jgi:Zn-dependent peptidase ImmA (M78 family)